MSQQVCKLLRKGKLQAEQGPRTLYKVECPEQSCILSCSVGIMQGQTLCYKFGVVGALTHCEKQIRLACQGKPIVNVCPSSMTDMLIIVPTINAARRPLNCVCIPQYSVRTVVFRISNGQHILSDMYRHERVRSMA